MNAGDQRKVLNMGFLILRERTISPISGSKKKTQYKIVNKTRNKSDWHDYEKGFPSYAAMRRRMTELLKSGINVED